jgi:predicted ATP-grasp superfamily ATP-dependent carboligase
LAGRFGLSGLFGVDAIAHADGIFPVEVNPRYTASVEVLECCLGFHAITLHAAACRDGRLPASLAAHDSRGGSAGKAILYAPRDGAAGEAFWRFVDEANRGCDWPRAADLPHRGENFVKGRPLLTLLAEGDNPDEVEQQLRDDAKRVFRLFDAGSP